jgi:hypothetical protein
VLGEHLSDGGGGVNDHHLFGYSRNLETRDELCGAAFPCAVEHVLRVMLTLRGPVD